MNTNVRLVAATMGAGLLALLAPALLAQSAERLPNADHPYLGTKIVHVGDAETKQVWSGGFYPTAQPEVYWHDPDWNIDLVIPPNNSDPNSDEPYSLSIRSGDGRASIARLGHRWAQVDSILRSPGDKAIIEAYCGGKCGGFLIVDLVQGKVVDEVGAYAPAISPNRRFLIFETGMGENLYHLYDVTKTPRENTCGYRHNDPLHANLDEDLRGIQVYPQKPGQAGCQLEDDPDDDNMGFDFTWAPDSSKIVFADVKDSVMSLILVTMPAGAKDLPKTSTYALAGSENICAAVQYCDFHIVKSLAWDGDTVKVVFEYGKRTVIQSGDTVKASSQFSKELAIPISKFVAIGK